MKLNLILFTVVVPKNTGLKEYREKGLAELNIPYKKILEVRGEDVGFWVNEAIKKGKKAIGLIGEDLFKEWCLNNNNTQIKIKKRIPWKDEKALFGKPVLCLLGEKDKTLEELPKNLKVGISAKYKALAKRYLNLLENKGYNFEKIYINGCVENAISEGVADLIIDIVYTGNSMKEYCLKVYDKILESDFLIIGGKDD